MGQLIDYIVTAIKNILATLNYIAQRDLLHFSIRLWSLCSITRVIAPQREGLLLLGYYWV